MKALFAVLLWMQTQSGAEPTSDDLGFSEWVGVEISPVWLQLSAKPDFQAAYPPPLAAGAAGTLRILRWRFGDSYWTPLQVGFGAGVPEMSAFAHATTEFGARVTSISPRLEIGVAIGAGLVAMEYANVCDGSCTVGGGPIMISPVARFRFLPGNHVSLSAFVRILAPLLREPGIFQNHGLGFMTLLGVDFAVER